MSGTILVQNLHAGPSVYTDEAGNRKIPYEWGESGHPDGTDYQEVPEDLTKQPPFRKAVSRGIFRLIDENTDQRFMDQGQRWQDQRSAVFAATESVIDRTSERSMAAVPCIGPGPQGQPCGAGVILTGTSKNQPPLCQSHKHLATTYAPVVDENGEERWVRATMAGRNQVD